VSDVDERMAAIDRGFDLLERGDLDAFMEIVEANSHPDVEFSSAIGLAMSASVFQGFDGIRAWFTEFLESFHGRRWKNRRYEVVSDDLFLLFASFEAKGASSEVPIETEIGQVFELEDGKFKRGRSYSSHAEARTVAEALVA
jgi:ketosteroid isomerase-like protein